MSPSHRGPRILVFLFEQAQLCLLDKVVMGLYGSEDCAFARLLELSADDDLV